MTTLDALINSLEAIETITDSAQVAKLSFSVYLCNLSSKS